MGCTGMEPAMIGAVAQTGSSVLENGKLRSSHWNSLDNMVAAAIGACDDLGLHIYEQTTTRDGHRVTIKAADSHSKGTVITFNRRADRLVRTTINVGFFGYDPTAQLLMKRIEAHLVINDDVSQ